MQLIFSHERETDFHGNLLRTSLISFRAWHRVSHSLAWLSKWKQNFLKLSEGKKIASSPWDSVYRACENASTCVLSCLTNTLENWCKKTNIFRNTEMFEANKIVVLFVYIHRRENKWSEQEIIDLIKRYNFCRRRPKAFRKWKSEKWLWNWNKLSLTELKLYYLFFYLPRTRVISNEMNWKQRKHLIVFKFLWNCS